MLGLTLPASAATGWTVITAPGPAAGITSSFALSDTDAWAVGNYSNAGVVTPTSLHWNGSAWSSVPTPAPTAGTGSWYLQSIAASSSTDAWAVGQDVVSPRQKLSLYEHWNGAAWSVVSGPNEGPLTSVLDFGPTDAWALAEFATLHWNGTAWSVVSNGLALGGSAVSADSPTDFWVIYRNDQVTHYNGTSWTVSTVSPASQPVIESVKALSPTDVWIAGATTLGTAATFLAHYNGTAWQTMTPPSAISDTGVPAMTARSDSDLWLFTYNNQIANWNGSSWTTTPIPIASSPLSEVEAATSSPSHIWLFAANNTGNYYILSHP
jgi:hypothetical protein